ncbi:type IX secretion/gliding motility protein PorT/SprT [Polluticaenibacter yanchengensis]|uniref:Porin family protein n=1 Tax=Polluticaenibacter yanchengensis TaxID=3014562 RepID=A0ABT4UHH3_9BACT|nr:porin family protein [Chitinophagaceae bacterium LY-5]
MHYLLRLQIILVTIVGFTNVSKAQIKELHRLEREEKQLYFGMSLGAVSTYLNPSKHIDFLSSDSIMSVEPGRSSGYSARFLATLKLNKRFELRFNPGLTLGVQRTFDYVLGSRQTYEKEVEKRIIESTYLNFPLHVKLNSDRINNFRVYMLAGLKYDYDLASNKNRRNAEDMLKLSNSDWGAEVGIGFNFYLRYFTLSPEIKISNGLGNIHARDANLKYSNILDKITSRSIFFTINIEE